MRVIYLMHFASFCFLLYAVFFVKSTRFCVIFITIIVQYLTIRLSLLLSTPSYSYHRQFPQSSGKKAGSRECARSAIPCFQLFSLTLPAHTGQLHFLQQFWRRAGQTPRPFCERSVISRRFGTGKSQSGRGCRPPPG